MQLPVRHHQARQRILRISNEATPRERRTNSQLKYIGDEMKSSGVSIRFVLCLIGLILASVCHAEEAAEMVAAEGSVMVRDSHGKENKPAQANSKLPSGTVVTTGPDARAVVRVGSDGFMVIGKNSQVEINREKDQAGLLRQITGLIYYAMNFIKNNQHPIQVRTVTAVIGVRGTRFLVADIEGRNEIGMRKGLINVASPEGEFEIHKKKEQEEFEAFKHEGEVAIAKEKREFEEYKARTQQEFIEYKREFGLEANQMATFDGKRVVERPLSDEMKKDMDSFETYAGKWLQEVHD